MVLASEIREGELAVEMPPTRDAGLVFIGRIRTPWTSRLEAPRQGRHDGPICRLSWSALRATRFWYAASIASMRRRWWI
jgi:hypothetical protein